MASFMDQVVSHARTRPNNIAVYWKAITLSFAELNELVNDVAAALDGFFCDERPEFLFVNGTKSPLWYAFFIYCSERRVIFSAYDEKRLHFKSVREKIEEQFTAASAIRLEIPRSCSLILNPWKKGSTTNWMLSGSSLIIHSFRCNEQYKISFNPHQERRQNVIFGEQLARNELPFYANWTSGTIGAPNVYLANSKNIYANTSAVVEATNLTSESAFLCTFSPTVHPHESVARPLFCGGATILCDNDPLAVSTTLNSVSRPVYLMTTPVHVRRMLDADDATKSRVANISDVELTGNACTPELDYRIRKELSSEVYSSWGSTQTSGVTVMAKRHPTEKRNSLLGSVVSGYKWELSSVIEEIEGQFLNGAGEFVVRGEAVIDQKLEAPYYDTIVPTGKRFASGDIMARDENGMLSFVSRLDNSIRVRGYRILAEVLEEALNGKLPNARVCVFGAPDDTDDEKVCVAIEAPHRVDLVEAVNHEIKSVTEGRVSSASVIFVDSLPTNGSGKLDRVALRRILLLRK